MSSGVPYVAPWQTGFEKYATQLFTPLGSGTSDMSMLIPENQWWRIIYLTAQLHAGAAASDRVLEAQIWAPDGGVPFATATPLTLEANDVGTYLFGPGLTSFVNAVPVNSQFACAALPDVLWPPGNAIHITGNLNGLTDKLFLGTFAIEVYSEDRPGVLVPELAPTPLIA